MNKKTLATLWLDGCSGCHMSVLDIDQRLLALATLVDIVYSPLVDTKIFPDQVDITLVEGAVSSEHDLELIQRVRQHTRTLIALGDCAVTANIPSMRNPFGAETILNAVYPQAKPTHPSVPALLPRVRPVHAVVPVDIFIPGCPPAADAIFFVISELLAGHQPDIHAMTRFG